MSYAARFARLMQSAGGVTPTKLLGLLYHLPNFIRLYYRLLHDKRVPLYLRALCWASIVYFFWPIDLIRDVPRLLFGHMDDIAFLFFSFNKLVKESPPDVVAEHVRQISEGR